MANHNELPYFIVLIYIWLICHTILTKITRRQKWLRKYTLILGLVPHPKYIQTKSFRAYLVFVHLERNLSRRLSFSFKLGLLKRLQRLVLSKINLGQLDYLLLLFLLYSFNSREK